MKVEIRELEIELIAENSHEQEALARLHKEQMVKIKAGHSRDSGWPPDPRMTNVVLCLSDPNNWGT
ncbi:MAG: hypothetical protein Q8Q06_03030 [bacterium]|nr:hypothetical protein [bacterium]